MNSKEYTLPNGKKAVFEYDHDGIGKVTIEAMDMLMGLIADGRKRGEWLPDENGDFRCTNCGRIAEWEFFEDNFCPNCGADMREREDE